MIMLLAPLYPDMCRSGPGGGAASAIPVGLQRTADDWMKLVFSTTEGQVEKDVACVNSHDGCHCDYARLLRALMVLTEREILLVDGKYVVMAGPAGGPRVATLQMRVSVARSAPRGESLKGFEFVLCHLQVPVLSVLLRSAKARDDAMAAALLDATCSSCHVVGCKLHPWDVDEALGSKPKLNLPDVFQSLMDQAEADQAESHVDTTSRTDREQPDGRRLVTDLPINLLQGIVRFMNGRDAMSLSGVCSLFRRLAYDVVPGLNLVLYDHQRKGLKWMLYRETPSLINRSLPHPFILSRRPGRDTEVAIDLITQKVVEAVDTRATDMCGGMFCDEPGLGKTITMLALILRTKGQTTHNTPVETHRPGAESARAGLRSSGSHDRTVRLEDLVSSGASLIVVPDPLVEHWKYQVETHVEPGALRVFVDPGMDYTLPCNLDLAEYDVVITSFSRLAREWRVHRPASAMEERMAARCGSDGSRYYADGTVRGEVSSLLTVHWVRVIVDEGHKLGGKTPTNLMEMARLLCAKRRWVMTGTPTPNTLQSADLQFMHGLLVFLRNQPYGMPDGRAWAKAIAQPFGQNQVISFYRLQYLLSRIMLRHTKESIQDILPEPIRHTVFIDPTPSEYAQYNVVAASVRANLVITNMDPEKPGRLHEDSLLNPMNRKQALAVVRNLRIASCGGVNSEVLLTEKARVETIDMLTEFDVEEAKVTTVVAYLRRVTLPGMTTECGSCKRQLQLLMVIPCGHLCCADCVEDRMTKVGPSCFLCGEVYDPEDFQELQPGFDFREIDERNDELPSARSQRVSKKRRHAIRQLEATAGPNRHYWEVEASKIFYAATRIRELKDQFARQNVAARAGGSSHERPRYVKAIIFSQFTEIIWRTKLAFEQQRIRTANFITRVAPRLRMQELKQFRTDPSLNVLLLSETGSHGLDLSFVTHIFLLEEIWDKSLEQQVISRAHRMGAKQAVVVEQLWMRGSVESQMVTMNSSDAVAPSGPPPVRALGPPARSRKRRRNVLLNVAGNARKRRRSGSKQARKVPSGNKSDFLQCKLEYALNHLRLLDKSTVANRGQVRFSVVNEHDGVIRRAIHTARGPGERALTTSSATSGDPGHLELGLQQTAAIGEVASLLQSTSNAVANRSVAVETQSARTVTSIAPTSGAAGHDTANPATQPQREPPPARSTPASKKKKRKVTFRVAPRAVTPPTQPTSGAAAHGTVDPATEPQRVPPPAKTTPAIARKRKVTTAAAPAPRAQSTSDAATNHRVTVAAQTLRAVPMPSVLVNPAAVTAVAPRTAPPKKSTPSTQRLRPQDIVVIDDDDSSDSESPLSQLFSYFPSTKKTGSPPEVIVIDSSSCSECSFHEGSDGDDSAGDGDESSSSDSEESKDDCGSGESDDDEDAATTMMVRVAQHRWAQRTALLADLGSSDDERQVQLASTLKSEVPAPEIDDDETESE
ncbi:hypothetical protein BBJ28_00016670 [Nothophytophthora sp. Chile5]|nr:hypothetical protein BBJ28_00016670 [Nothophytophthora sp. Chile5]